MTWWAVWQTSNGRLISTTTTDPTGTISGGQSITNLGENPPLPPAGTWNETTHVFDANPASNIIGIGELLQRFTEAELVLYGEAGGAAIGEFHRWLQALHYRESGVDLSAQQTSDMFDKIVPGVITAARKTAILT